MIADKLPSGVAIRGAPIPAALHEMLQSGRKVRLFINEGNKNNKLIHIIGVVDGEHIVYKYWRPKKKYWQYRVEHVYQFVLWHESGWI